MDLINEAPLEALFDEYSGRTFADKIKIFKEWCDFGGVPDEHKATLQRLYKELDELRSIRNFLVHGETWEGAFKGKPRQPYRVGLVKKTSNIWTSSSAPNTVLTSLTSSRCVMRHDAAPGFTGN
jgi:hypothetical protein